MASVRMICVLLSMACRWFQRPIYMKLFNSIYRLYRKNPEIIRYCRRSIVSKCFCAITSELLQIIIIIIICANRLSFSVALSIWCVFCLTSTVNVIISQHFAAIAIIRGRYTLINKNIRSALADIQPLIPNNSGVFMTKCCHLADIFEDMARAQSHLQKLTECLSRTYRVQIICLFIMYYLNHAGICYFMFSIKKYSLITTNWPGITLVGAVLHLTFYYLDCWLNLFNIFYLIDSHYEMVKLLSQRTLFQPGLDQRLEAVLDSFILNLARNPFKLNVLGLFKIDRLAAFAVANSLLTHSILLIQYDVEHHKNWKI
ncbi:putative gustatory receptor 59d isoform X2 [Drosophila biarmipes]|nr:putative gustatory receptor 59d isoform X2 [Drosophila biarmipes]